jgi:formate dehydrogenase alpha subunit
MNVKITIDGKPLVVDSSQTILQAARQNQIYIPTLCDYPSLIPHGSCRLCIVEMKGSFKTPAACTTPVEEGMSIRTNTPQLRYLRSEILKMMLSEHPLSCLLCTEKENCQECMITTRKSGVVTGCNTCPKNGACELQELVESIGIIGFNYPVRYRGIKVERSDPFFDRDYNLCIHCARCLRVCENIHLTGTLAYIHKGPDTVVGTAFDRNHIEAGCSFCGACVEVCPTGALTEKTRKWEGLPDDETLTTCPLCSIGCQMWVLSKNSKTIGSMSAQLPGDGHLCVKGRFGVPELVNHPSRLKHPQVYQGGRYLNVDWDKAIGLVAEKLSACLPGQFGMLVSANSSNEDLYVAQKFTRTVIGSNNITTSARGYYGDGFGLIPGLLKHTVTLAEIENADTVLCLGLETRYAQSVIEARLVHLRKGGGRFLSLHPYPHNLASHADLWLRPSLQDEATLLEWLANAMQEGESLPEPPVSIQEKELALWRKASNWLAAPGKLVIIVGQRYLRHPENWRILAAVADLAERSGSKLIFTLPQNNFTGALMMGAYQELLPGGVTSRSSEQFDKLRRIWNKSIPQHDPAREEPFDPFRQPMRLLYLIGDSLPAPRSPNEFVIYHNIYPPATGCQPGLVLPGAAFTEMDGSYLNHQGRLLTSRSATPPPGEAMPAWQVLCRLAKYFGASGFDFQDVAEIQNEIANFVEGFEVNSKVELSPLSGLELVPTSQKTTQQQPTPPDPNPQAWPFSLDCRLSEHVYQGFSLNTWVAGMNWLYPEDRLVIHPADATRLEINPGDPVQVTTPNFRRVWSAQLDEQQAPGTLSVALTHAEALELAITRAQIKNATLQSDGV